MILMLKWCVLFCRSPVVYEESYWLTLVLWDSVSACALFRCWRKGRLARELATPRSSVKWPIKTEDEKMRCMQHSNWKDQNVREHHSIAIPPNLLANVNADCCMNQICCFESRFLKSNATAVGIHPTPCWELTALLYDPLTGFRGRRKGNGWRREGRGWRNSPLLIIILHNQWACVCLLRHYSRELLDLLLNVDKLLATDEHFLLGVWLENAKNISTSDQQRRLYEYNARNQITLWGPDGNVCRCRLIYFIAVYFTSFDFLLIFLNMII